VFSAQAPGLLKLGRARLGGPVPSEGLGPAIWLLLYPLVFAFFYAANTHGDVGHYGYEGFRYLVPLYPILLVLIALALNGMWQARGARGLLSAIATVVILAAGLGSTLQMISKQNIGRALSYKPYSYKEFGFQRGGNPPLDLKGMTGLDRAFYLLGRGWWVGLGLEASQKSLVLADGQQASFIREGAATTPELREVYFDKSRDEPVTTGAAVMAAEPGNSRESGEEYFFYRAFGLGTVERHALRESTEALRKGLPSAAALAAAADELQTLGLPKAYERHAYAGLGAAFSLAAFPYYQFDATTQAYLQAIVGTSERVPEPYRADFFEAFGESIGVDIEFTVLDRLDVVLRQINEQVPEPQRDHVYRGLGRGIGWRFGADRNRSDDLIARVDQRYRSQSVRGLLEFLQSLERFSQDR
jgi:hypothetical protein